MIQYLRQAFLTETIMKLIFLIICVISTVTAFCKLGASFASFALASDRGGMPGELKGLTVASDIVHGFNDISHFSFYMSAAVFSLSGITTVYSPYGWVFKVSLILLLSSALCSFLFINANGINGRIAEMREKWARQKQFTDEHDHEVNYVHIMEAARDDLPGCLTEAALIAVIVFLL